MKTGRWLGLLCAVGVGFVAVSCDDEMPTEPEVTTPTITETAATPLFDVQPNDPGICMGNDANAWPANVSGFSATTDPNSFNCTANDVVLANARVANTQGPIQCVGGTVVTVDIVADVVENSQSARTDIGIWIADGANNPNNAEDGLCAFFFLPFGENSATGIADADGDECGDMDNAGTVDNFALDQINILCSDPNQDGFVEIASCVSWTQPGGDRECPQTDAGEQRAGTLPANKSKCNCEPFLVPIIILSELTLEKTVVNNNGGTAVDTDWTLTGTGDQTPTPDVITGVEGAASITLAQVLPGTYTLTESGGPADYSTDGVWSCTGDGTFTTPNQITLAGGDQATCVITNTDDPVYLTLTKKVINDNGGTAVDTDWTLTGTGDQGTPVVITGVEGAPAITNAEVSIGTYTLTESSKTGYSTDGIWSCTGDGTFTSPDTIALALGESASCEITNTDDPPGLTLLKKVINDDGGLAVDTDWTLCFTNGSNACGVEGHADVTNAVVTQGTYTLSEKDGPANYSTDGVWACTGGTFTSPNKIAVGLGESASCEITNDDNEPTLTLLKKVINDNGGGAVDTDWTLSFAGPSNGSGVEGDAAITNAVVNGGTYTLAESAGPEFYKTDGIWACTGGTYTSPNQIALGSGQSASCEITNDDVERCAPGDRLTSVSLEVTAASPNPIPLLEITDDSGNLTNAAVLKTVNPAGTTVVFTVTPAGTFFDSQNLRFALNGDWSKDLKVHLSCSDDPYVGQTHSGSADGASITLTKTAFETTQF